MNSVVKLSIALVAAVAAGAGNYLWMDWQQKQHASFVVAKSAVKAGELIKAENLESIRIPGEFESLRKTFIPSSLGIPLLVGVRATRDYQPGDLILHEHLDPNIPHWKALGSFKLLSVGERVRTGGTYSGGRGSNTVTIAASVDKQGNYDAKTERLLDILAEISNRNSKFRIVAIQLDPAPEGEDVGTVVKSSKPSDLGADESLELGAQDRGIMVPLKSVETIPEVLARGSYISFIVDWFEESTDEVTPSSADE